MSNVWEFKIVNVWLLLNRKISVACCLCVLFLIMRVENAFDVMLWERIALKCVG